jgi:hypothetical protein
MTTENVRTRKFQSSPGRDRFERGVGGVGFVKKEGVRRANVIVGGT